MNKYAAIAAVLLLYTCNSQADQRYLVNQDQVNVRSDSTVSAAIIGQLGKNEKVEVAQENFEWCKIKLPERFSGYVWKTYLKRLSKTQAEVTATRLNMRQEPSLEAPVIGQLPKGKTVYIKNTLGDWVEISAYPFATGWIHKKFLTPDSDNTDSQTEPSSDDILLSAFVRTAIESLTTAGVDQKKEIIQQIVDKGENVITLIDKELDPDNEALTYDMIAIFTRLAQKNPALISFFLKKAESPSITLASIYLDVLQNLLETNKEKKAYYYLAKQETLSREEIDAVREKYRKIHGKNIFSRTNKATP